MAVFNCITNQKQKDMKKVLWLMAMVLPLLFAGCGGSDEDVVDNSPMDDVVLNYQQDLPVPESEFSGTVISDNFIASYSPGIIRGLHVGKTKGRLPNGKTFNIVVRSWYGIIKEISREWGTSRESLITNSELGTFKKSTSAAGDVWGATSSDGKIIYMYSFTDGVLSSSSIVVQKGLVDAVANYLKERFTMVDLSSIFAGGYDAYSVDNAKTIVAVTVFDANHYMLSFMPNNK